VHSGKVRDVYDAGDDRLLLVASDRMSAFDVVMAEVIPDKGRVLTAMSAFWFDRLADVAPSHLVTTDPAGFPPGAAAIDDVAGRATLVRRADMLPIECIVRGYLSGSAWKEYRTSGTMHGAALPRGLRESDCLPEPVFTPSTKAAIGDKDENISFDAACDLVGADVAKEAREISLVAYRQGADWAAERGSPSATRCSRPTPPASGLRMSGPLVRRRHPSTSSPFATGSQRVDGTRSRPRQRSRPRSWPQRESGT
jgi:phosphoribosylaminoimidazole-succinocarboxamide synthase